MGLDSAVYVPTVRKLLSPVISIFTTPKAVRAKIIAKKMGRSLFFFSGSAVIINYYNCQTLLKVSDIFYKNHF